jgi:hypothetical protein
MSQPNRRKVMASKLKQTPHKGSLADAVSEAFSELQSLGEEMRDAFDNTPESLQQSAVGEARGEAADALEGLDEPDVDDMFGSVPVEWSTFHKRRESRSLRRDNACSALDQAISALQALQDDDEAIKAITAEHTDKSIDDIKEAAESLRDDLERLKDDAEAVEFPGMYG